MKSRFSYWRSDPEGTASTRLRALIIFGIMLLLIFGGAVVSLLLPRGDDEPSTSPALPPASSPSAVSFSVAELKDPASPLVLVNKQQPLSPIAFAPTELVQPVIIGNSRSLSLRPDASRALDGMAAAAAADGITLTLESAYRSYDLQERLFASYAARDGEVAASRYSARPGYSEHQTGLAADVGQADGACRLATCFGATAAGRWVAEHAWEHGFIVRYEEGSEPVTGYSHEPWHLRFLGKNVAADYHKGGFRSYERYLQNRI